MTSWTGSWTGAARLATWGWLAAMAACWSLGSLVSDRQYLVAGGLAGAAVAATGVVGRRLHLPFPLVLVLQVFVLLEWATMTYASAEAWWVLVPTRDSMTALGDLVQLAITTSNEYAPPAPANRGVDAALAMVVGAVALAVDAVAVGWRRPAVAGLVFLAVYMVPVSLLAGEVPMLAFVPGALAFVFLLGAEQRDRVTHWGRQIGVTGSLLSVRDRAVTVSALIESGRRVGLGAVALAIVVPALVPTFPRTFLADGPLSAGEDSSGGGDGQVTVDNPMLDLRRNLDELSEQVLLTVRSDDGTPPSYLRIAALDEFTGVSWEPSPRTDENSTPVERAASPPGLLSSVQRDRVVLDVQVSELFQTTWLPTLYPVTTMEVEDEADEWRVDQDHLDVSARSEDLDGAGVRYRAASTLVQPSVEDLVAATAPDEEEVGEYLALPDGMPPVVEELAQQVTAGEVTDFDRAMALQDWFRTEGDFEYSLGSAPGDGLSTIERFLETERVGYCEQFAAAMALMARELGIPARVAVGFLRPEAGAEGTWVFRGSSMHAWPELYFETVGWVGFEPTPAARTGAPPSFGDQSGTGPTTTATAPNQPTRSARPEIGASAPPDAESAAGAGGGGPGNGPLVGGGIALLLLAAVAPRLTRAGVRRRRWRQAADAEAGGRLSTAEAGWLELRDLAVDLGVRVDDAATLRAAGRSLRTFVDDDPVAVGALNALVLDVERSRFARRSTVRGRAADEVRADVERVRSRLAVGQTSNQRLRATWLPRSLWARRQSAVAGPRADPADGLRAQRLGSRLLDARGGPIT